MPYNASRFVNEYRDTAWPQAFCLVLNRRRTITFVEYRQKDARRPSTTNETIQNRYFISSISIHGPIGPGINFGRLFQNGSSHL